MSICGPNCQWPACPCPKPAAAAVQLQDIHGPLTVCTLPERVQKSGESEQVRLGEHNGGDYDMKHRTDGVRGTSGGEPE